MGLIKVPELKQYIYRKLGHPVINVEVDEMQLDDCIDEALKTFNESHYDSCEIGYLEVEVEQGVSEYTLSESVQDVMECMNIEGYDSSIWGIPSEPILLSRPWFGSESLMFAPYYDVVDVEIYRQRLQMIEDTYKKWIMFEFNPISKKLTFPEAPYNTGTRVLKIVQVAVDPDETNTVLDSLWFKKYAVALARIQWGVNVGKYTGAQLPGGVEINADGILQKGEADKEALLTELDEKYSDPPTPVFA